MGNTVQCTHPPSGGGGYAHWLKHYPQTPVRPGFANDNIRIDSGGLGVAGFYTFLTLINNSQSRQYWSSGELLPRSVQYPTQSYNTMMALKPDMVQEGGGNPNVPWTGDGRDRHIGVLDINPAVATIMQPIEGQQPVGQTSTDAAGLPQFGLVPTYENLQAGEIKGALRITVPIPPARDTTAEPRTCSPLPPSTARAAVAAPTSHGWVSGSVSSRLTPRRPT